MREKKPWAPEGNALVYCDGGFNTTYGKTAHGLIRFSRRYRILGVVDHRYAGQDAGAVLDGRSCDIPVFDSLHDAFKHFSDAPQAPPTHFIFGLAPDGGRLDGKAREAVMQAMSLGLHVDCGLHTFLSEDPEFVKEAERCGVRIRDIRKPPSRDRLHFFSGKIEQVDSLKIAVLGTDSAVGKRTTAWLIVDGFLKKGMAAELVGTGQTAWLQGARYSMVLDALVNDFVSGEIEHAVWSAWHEQAPDIIVIEGQGSLMNPAYPGGFEILAAGRPDIIVLQHAPARREYDGFPGYPIQPLSKQIALIERLSSRPVVAVTVNHEDLAEAHIPVVCDSIRQIAGIPAFDALKNGPEGLVDLLIPYVKGNGGAGAG